MKINIIYGTKSVQIVNSYLIFKKQQQIEIIEYIKRNKQCPKEVKNRSTKSLYREWKVHNCLYKLGLYRDRTKDVDFNKLAWYINLIYNLIGIFII